MFIMPPVYSSVSIHVRQLTSHRRVDSPTAMLDQLTPFWPGSLVMAIANGRGVARDEGGKSGGEEGTEQVSRSPKILAVEGRLMDG